MSAKAVREANGKAVLAKHLPKALGDSAKCLASCSCVTVTAATDLKRLSNETESWLKTTVRYVVYGFFCGDFLGAGNLSKAAAFEFLSLLILLSAEVRRLAVWV